MGYVFTTSWSKAFILTTSAFLVMIWSATLYCGIIRGVSERLLIGCPAGWKVVSVGFREIDVQIVLGEPNYDCSLVENTCPESVNDFIRPPRIPSKRVFLYYSCNMCFFVFLNDDGVVVATAIRPRRN